MQVHQHQRAVTARDGKIADQQAALQVGGADRPGKGTGQRDPLRLRDAVLRHGIEPAVHLADGRQGKGNKIAGIVEGVDPGKIHIAACQVRGLVDAIGTGGVGVHLLQQDQIRCFAAVQIGVDAVKVFAHGVGARGLDLLAAVHKEVRVLAQTAVAHVPAEHVQVLARGQQLVRGLQQRQVLHGLGLIFCRRQPAEQTARSQDKDEDQDQ